MSDNKRYYWLKLKDNFFKKKAIKKLRKIAGGDTYVIIYLQMQLLSINNNGLIFFEGYEDTFAEELALELDEDVENVKVTMLYLEKNNLLEIRSDTDFFLPEVKNLIGSETASTQRSRTCRVNKKMLQCNTNATKCNTEKEKEREKELDKDLEKEKDEKQKIVLKNYCPAGPDCTFQKKSFDKNFSQKAKEIIDYLNTKINSKYKSNNSKTLKLIKSRINEGFTVEDFKTVIDKKSFEWAENPNMCQYLRPVTLFSNKFESYLNQPFTKEISASEKNTLEILNHEFLGNYFDE